jgi:LL-diaminopimelate aminotransferase
MTKIRPHSDRGIFYPLSIATTAALTGTMEFVKKCNVMYQARRDVVVNRLRKCGIEVAGPKATFYIWASLPRDVNNSKE